jgi:hypothetical protein
VVLLKIAHQLQGLAPVVAKLRNQGLGAGGDLLLHLVVLLHLRRLGVLEGDTAHRKELGDISTAPGSLRYAARSSAR